jgi:hypothetical protein
MPKPTLDDLLSGSDPLLDVKPAPLKAASSVLFGVQN